MKAVCFGMVFQTLETSQPTDSSLGNDFILLPLPTLSELTDTHPVTLVSCMHQQDFGRT